MSKRITKTYVRNNKTIVIAPQIRDCVEDGVYNSEIIDAEIVKTTSGNHYLRTTFEMEDDKVGVYNIYLDENPYGNFGQIVKIGLKDDIKEIEVEDLVGIKIKVYLKTTEMRQNIVGVEPPDEDIEDDDENEKVESGRHMRGNRQNTNRPGVGRGRRNSTEEEEEDEDDDIDGEDDDDDDDEN